MDSLPLLSPPSFSGLTPLSFSVLIKKGSSFSKKALIPVFGLFFLAISGLMMTPSAQAAGLEDPQRAQTLILAKVGDNPKKIYPRLKALADYLAKQLADQGIIRGEVMVAPDNKTMAGWVKHGRVDLVTETPFSAAYLIDRGGAKAIARGWRKGVRSYHSVIFVRRDSEIESLSDLVGKTIAFEDEGSTSAYYLPAAELLGQGVSLVQLMSVRESSPATEVGYVFSGEEINSTTWVHKKLVDAAALSNLDWDADDTVPPLMRKDLRIVHRTLDYPRSVELASPVRPATFVDRLAEELHRSHETPEGQAAMKAYKKTSRFEPVDKEMREIMESASKLQKRVKMELD